MLLHVVSSNETVAANNERCVVCYSLPKEKIRVKELFPSSRRKKWSGWDLNAGLPDSQDKGRKLKKKKNVLPVSPMGALQSVLCRHCFLSLQQP